MLAVFGSMSLSDRTRPLSLIFEGPSGSGKTTVVEMAFPLSDSDLTKYVYRSDKFTPRAFVSHAANKRRADLKKIDLLPRLEDKVLLTKELAPIFRGREQEMQDNFSTLISILDGMGFVSDSGMQGQRGYDRKILFNWIGATTPLPSSVHRLMSQLGTRLLFFEVPSVALAETDLLAFAKNKEPSISQTACNNIVNEFLVEFFERFPVGSVRYSQIRTTDALLSRLIKLACFLVTARAEIVREMDAGKNWVPVSVMPPEGVHKVINYLKDLAFGQALINGRTELTSEDLDLVEEVVISSIPRHLRQILRYLRSHDEIDTPRVCSLCNASAPTARNYMKEIALLGIADSKRGSPRTCKPNCISLTTAYDWFRIKP
jgi:hypothetical protein